MQKNIMNPLENLLITCVFNGFPCSEEDFVWFVDGYYGNCFKFNTKLKKNSKIFRPGIIAGLQVDVLLGNQKICEFPNNYGLHIFINNVSS